MITALIKASVEDHTESITKKNVRDEHINGTEIIVIETEVVTVENTTALMTTRKEVRGHAVPTTDITPVLTSANQPNKNIRPIHHHPRLRLHHRSSHVTIEGRGTKALKENLGTIHPHASTDVVLTW